MEHVFFFNHSVGVKTTHAHNVKFCSTGDDRCERLVSNLATGTHTCECQHPTKGSLGSPLIHRTALHCGHGHVCFCRSNKCCLRADKKNIWRSALRSRQKTHDGCNHIWQETNSSPKLLLLPHDSFPSGTSEEIHLRFQRRQRCASESGKTLAPVWVTSKEGMLTSG